MLLSLHFINQAKAMLREASQLQWDTLESLSDRIRAVEEARYGGILIWKITNISSRIRDAVSGRVKVLLSPDLYTNVQGKFICVTFSLCSRTCRHNLIITSNDRLFTYLQMFLIFTLQVQAQNTYTITHTYTRIFKLISH